MFMSINNPSSTPLIIYSFKKLSICKFTHDLFFQNTFKLSPCCKQVSNKSMEKTIIMTNTKRKICNINVVMKMSSTKPKKEKHLLNGLRL